MTSNNDMSTPPGAYPVADLARMSQSSAALLLHRATVDSEGGAQARQHVVIARDIDTGDVTYSGTYPSGLEALTVAHRITEQNRAVEPHSRFTVTVTPVLPL